MKTILAIVLILSAYVVQAQHNPFAELDYDKVVAYDYNGNGGKHIVQNDHLMTYYVNDQRQLLPTQIQLLHNTLIDSATYGNTTAACFDPHMGIVYYKGKKVVAYISICLECNYLEASFEIEASKRMKETMDGYLPLKTGFSLKARQILSDFCMRLKFSHCAENEVDFYDK